MTTLVIGNVIMAGVNLVWAAGEYREQAWGWMAFHGLTAAFFVAYPLFLILTEI